MTKSQIAEMAIETANKAVDGNWGFKDYLIKQIEQALIQAHDAGVDDASNILVNETILSRDYSWLLRCDYANRIRALKLGGVKK